MEQKAIVIAVGSLLVASVAHADVDLLGKEVVFYGKIHASVDYYDLGSSTATVTKPSGTEITSNSSRIGFKGKKDLRGDTAAIWMFESEVDYAGESGVLRERNRFIGLESSWGTVKLGVHDTPVKDVGADFTAFGDTIGDRRGLLGCTSTGKNVFSVRAKSMAKYEFKSGDFTGGVMYSPDAAGVNNPDGGTTTNDSLIGVGVGYKTGDLVIGGAYEKQEDIGNSAGKNASAYRIGAKYKTGPWQFGGVFETLSDDGYGKVIEHNGFGANVAYKIDDYTFAGQYLHAGSSDVGNDAASQYTAGVTYDIAKPAQIYVAYSTINNDDGASYAMALSGHGQSYVPTKAGETVSVMSVGMIYSF